MINLLNFTECNFPFLSKTIWKTLYGFLAWRFPQQEWVFMNYGYHDDHYNLELLPEDETNRYFIQMYSQALDKLDLTNKDLLEVGSGRGGGSEWLARTQNLNSVTGLDLSNNAVKLCQKLHQLSNLKYVQGDAEKLPFVNESFDIVVNIESCHHYPSVSTFFQEVTRVLKIGGYFCIADYFHFNDLSKLKQDLIATNLELIYFEDITSQVIAALKLTQSFKINMINNNVPWFLTNLLKTFAAVENTEVYNQFINGKIVYISAILRK